MGLISKDSLIFNIFRIFFHNLFKSKNNFPNHQFLLIFLSILGMKVLLFFQVFIFYIALIKNIQSSNPHNTSGLKSHRYRSALIGKN